MSFDLGLAAGFLKRTFHSMAFMVDSRYFVAFDVHPLTTSGDWGQATDKSLACVLAPREIGLNRTSN